MPTGFAYNRRLASGHLYDLAYPSKLVMIFESDLGWNGSGGREAVIRQPRHPGGVVVGFADGHVKVVKPEELVKLQWGAHGEG